MSTGSSRWLVAAAVLILCAFLFVILKPANPPKAPTMPEFSAGSFPPPSYSDGYVPSYSRDQAAEPVQAPREEGAERGSAFQYNSRRDGDTLYQRRGR